MLHKDEIRKGALRYHLGEGAEEHTIYDAELVGVILGAELLRQEDKKYLEGQSV